MEGGPDSPQRPGHTQVRGSLNFILCSATPSCRAGPLTPRTRGPRTCPSVGSSLGSLPPPPGSGSQVGLASGQHYPLWRVPSSEPGEGGTVGGHSSEVRGLGPNSAFCTRPVSPFQAAPHLSTILPGAALDPLLTPTSCEPCLQKHSVLIHSAISRWPSGPSRAPWVQPSLQPLSPLTVLKGFPLPGA